MEKTCYGDFEEKYRDYETAEIAILPVPYDGTSTWLKGADKGPQAILEASPNMEFYDIETDSEVYTHGIATLEPVTEDASPEAMAEEVERRMDAILADKKFPVLLGGEHSVSIGAFKAIAKHYDTFSILQLDAHSDMRDEYEGSPYNHACVMARGKEITESIAQVGIRSTASEESIILSLAVFFMLMKLKKREIPPGCMKYLRNCMTMFILQSTWTFWTLPTCRQQELRNRTVSLTEKFLIF